jgi:hypothetical protein
MSRHMMFCISGWAGTGKDECCGRLVRDYGAIHTGLADPGKRHMQDAYGFTTNQLWGPSEFRNAGDVRYPKQITKLVNLQRWNVHPENIPDDVFDIVDKNGNQYIGGAKKDLWYLYDSYDDINNSQSYLTQKPNKLTKDGLVRYFVREGDPDFWLSPRESLQQYMELMNTLYSDTWIRKGIQDHRLIASGYAYSKEKGLFPVQSVDPISQFITCFSDFRHIHEHKLAREAADENLVPVIIRIKRPIVAKPPFNHRSETEQTRIKDSAYDFVIENDSTLYDLYRTMDDIVKICSDPNWNGKQWKDEYVLSDTSDKYHP